LFRAYLPPAYRRGPAWTERATALDLALRALGEPEGFDLQPVREALRRAGSERELDEAAGLFDAALIAGTARRYLESPESCLFLGDTERGYVILPADGFMRRVALGETRSRPTQLFPSSSLRERLGAEARLRTIDLLSVPGRPQRLEATFGRAPAYEFDNLDEMLWWKHCRHLSGPTLPTEGLRELFVQLGGEPEAPGSLQLVRSRHRTLSFRFEPPLAWRQRVPTRDGRTYPFRVVRAVYETLPANS
ncbi:MAG TPA: hypothetical protein VJS92_16145, partial [Candidatus Polarisedimenticolaceae bacterium]|nr:hypothetical protein [Candidatus Polarisedimenticolaceae bacterium]